MAYLLIEDFHCLSSSWVLGHESPRLGDAADRAEGMPSQGLACQLVRLSEVAGV